MKTTTRIHTYYSIRVLLPCMTYLLTRKNNNPHLGCATSCVQRFRQIFPMRFPSAGCEHGLSRSPHQGQQFAFFVSFGAPRHDLALGTTSYWHKIGSERMNKTSTCHWLAALQKAETHRKWSDHTKRTYTVYSIVLIVLIVY